MAAMVESRGRALNQRKSLERVAITPRSACATGSAGKTVTIVRVLPVMHSDLEKLIALQQADREIERLNQEIALLPRRVAAIESKLAETRSQVEKAKNAIAATQKE